jgi:hypothetical protein
MKVQNIKYCKSNFSQGFLRVVCSFMNSLVAVKHKPDQSNPKSVSLIEHLKTKQKTYFKIFFKFKTQTFIINTKTFLA